MIDTWAMAASSSILTAFVIIVAFMAWDAWAYQRFMDSLEWQR